MFAEDEDVPALDRDRTETKGPGYHGKYRKKKLERKRSISCGRCKYHRFENRTAGKRRSWKVRRKTKKQFR